MFEKGQVIPPEVRKKMSDSAKKRWDRMTPKQEIAFRKRRSLGMKKYWKKKTKAERKAIALKMRKTWSLRVLRGKGLSEEEIAKIMKERYGED